MKWPMMISHELNSNCDDGKMVSGGEMTDSKTLSTWNSWLFHVDGAD